MNSSTLRRLWTAIEETQTPVLLRLNDAELIEQLLVALDNKMPMTREETCSMSSYLHSKTSLIRDIAHARLAV